MKIIRALLLAAALPAAAQDYPARPIRIILGYAAGGGNDLIVRVMAPRLSEALGQPVIVENKPGAQAIIATEYVAKAAADGYTILMGPTGPMAMNPATYAKLPYSSTRDFAPISTIGQFPLIVTVGASLPVHSVKELIDYAKKNPGKANYGSSAAAFQIATELFKQRTGTEFVHIPYKSSGESVQATRSPKPACRTSRSGCGPASSRRRARLRRLSRGCRRKPRAWCACPKCSTASASSASIRSAAAPMSCVHVSRATSRSGPPSPRRPTSRTSSRSERPDLDLAELDRPALGVLHACAVLQRERS